MSDQKNNAVSRRSFIRNVSFATAFLLTGNLRKLTAKELYQMRGKVAMRFVVASDAHYEQPNTAFDEMIEKVINQINLFHKENPLDFCVINGDLIHNEKPLLPKVKKKLDVLTMPLHITRGNHDMVTEDEWKQVFNKPLNYDAVVKKNALILGDTSNEKGIYLSPDLVWLKAKLDEHKKRKHVFLFLHIPQAKWTANGIDTPAFFELIQSIPQYQSRFSWSRT